MDAEELQAIRERAEKATPGPWHFDADDMDIWCRNDGGSFPLTTTIAKALEDEDRYFDFEFIAAAREDIPALVAEVERLREALEGMANTDHDDPHWYMEQAEQALQGGNE